ncbi:MAG: ribbon-helix-helix domain-containing protein [Candidatus Woesearchaeota archaeon]
MVTEMITLKLDDKFLSEIDSIVSTKGYQNRTEFIRNALREKIDEVKLKEAMLEIGRLRGASKRKEKITDEDLERTREEISKELEKGSKNVFGRKVFRDVL